MRDTCPTLRYSPSLSFSFFLRNLLFVFSFFYSCLHSSPSVSLTLLVLFYSTSLSSPTQIHTPSFFPSHSLTHSLTHTYTLTLTHSHLRTHTGSVTLLTHTRIKTHTHTHQNTHAHTSKHTHTHQNTLGTSTLRVAASRHVGPFVSSSPFVTIARCFAWISPGTASGERGGRKEGREEEKTKKGRRKEKKKEG